MLPFAAEIYFIREQGSLQIQCGVKRVQCSLLGGWASLLNNQLPICLTKSEKKNIKKGRRNEVHALMDIQELNNIPVSMHVFHLI